MKLPQLFLAAATLSVTALFSSCAFQPEPYGVAPSRYAYSGGGGGYYDAPPRVASNYYDGDYYGGDYYDPYYTSVYNPTVLIDGGYWLGGTWHNYNRGRGHGYYPRPGNRGHGYPHYPGGGSYHGGSGSSGNHHSGYAGSGNWSGSGGNNTTWSGPRGSSTRFSAPGSTMRMPAVQSAGRPQMQPARGPVSSGSGGGGSRGDSRHRG